MALDTFPDIWGRVLLRAPDVDPFIAQDFVRNAFRRVAERRRWSWLINFGQFIAPNAYVTGTVSVTQGSTTVTGVGTAWTSAVPSIAFQQFRIGLTAPIYTVASITDDTHIELDSPYGGPTATNTVYRIYQCFFPVPIDFHSFLTVWDPAMNWQLYLNVKQEELNQYDSQRATMGNPWTVSYRDSSIYSPQVTPGTPPIPRYELWPHILGRTIPFLYESRATDLTDPNAVLPRYIRGDVLLESSLAEAAAFPGTTTKPNSYYSPPNARRHDARSEVMIAELERQDDETDMQDLMRSYNVPWSYALPFGDSAWLQSHAVLFA